MSLFKLESLIGEGTHGFIRRVGNQPLDPKTRSPHARSNAVPDAGANLAAMLDRKSEVMVKISGFGRGKGVKAALDYVGRDGDLELEKPDGTKVRGKKEIAGLATQWGRGERRKHPKQRDTMNLVLSMPPGTDPGKVLRAVRAFGKAEFADQRDYVLVQHTDENHPHVHMVVRMAGFDGHRLNPRKADLQHWRESFAEQLREQGIAAAATPRRARGVVKKPTDQTLLHMRRRGKRPEVDGSQLREAIQRLRDGPSPQPWDRAIRDRQAKIRGVYQRAATDLSSNPDAADQQLGRKIAAFVREMPPPRTQQDELIEQLVGELQRGRSLDDPSNGRDMR